MMEEAPCKRAGAASFDFPRKKARHGFATSELDDPEDGYSDVSSIPSIQSTDELQNGILTPQTPASSKASPIWPSNLKTIPCEYPNCDKTFNRPAKLAQHLRSHTNTRPFVCSYAGCNKDFLRSSHLQHHIRSAHTNVRDYICQYEGCGKSFITGTRLKRHNATHEGKQSFACTVEGCRHTFRKHSTLHNHIISVHESGKAYTCQLLNGQGDPCGAGFDTASHLARHECTVHSGKIYRCTLCDSGTEHDLDAFVAENERVTFSTLLELQAHTSLYHPPTCQKCGLIFRHPSELAMHVEAKHANLTIEERRKYPCLEPDCGRSFTQKGNLVTHMNNFHLENKMFVCGHTDPGTLTRINDWDGSNACGRSMSTKGNLIEHIRTVHLGFEPSRKAQRKQKAVDAKASAHPPKPSTVELLTGSGYEFRRELVCLVHDCGYRFYRDYDLQRHLEHHHALKESEIKALRTDVNSSSVRRCLDGSDYMANATEFKVDRYMSPQFGDDGNFRDYFDELEESAANGGPFWLGESQSTGINETATSKWIC